jgi:cysteine desulfurase
MNHRHPIYLDHNATTPVDPRVVRVIAATLETTFGNPHSLDHSYGQAAREVVTVARDHVAELVGAESKGVVFTSGATEAIRLALDHAQSELARSRPLRIVSSPVEHRAMLDALSHLESGGRAVVRYLSVDRAGRIDLDELAAACDAGTDLVSMMAANNEVGTTYPIRQVAEVAAAAGAATLIDGTQAVGKITVDVTRWGLTYLCLSGHKLYGPKGVGALILGRSSRWIEKNERGTPNVPGIAGLGEACHLRGLEMAEDETRIATLRDRLSSLLRAAIPDLVENGDIANRLAGSLHICVPGTPNGPVLARLHDRVALSSGSACRSGAEAPSHVLTAMGFSEPLLGSALRISLGKFTTDVEITAAAGLIAQAVNEVRDALN